MIKDNKTRFNKVLDPTRPLVIYIHKQEKCQAFSINAGNSILDSDMVQTGITHTLKTQLMKDAWHDWKHLPIAQQTWTWWWDHFIAAFKELRELQEMESGDMGCGANAIIGVNDELKDALEKLALAAMSKTDTVEALAASTKKLADAVERLTQEN